MSAILRGLATLQAGIFDLDGTLVDSEPLYEASDTAFLKSFGIVLDSLSEGEFVGIGTLSFLTMVAERFPDSPLAALPVEELVRRKDEAYLKFAQGKLRPFPAVAALAVELRRRGLRLAVASGSSADVIAAELRACGFGADLFDFTISASEVKRGKPEPDIFLEAAKRLKLPNEACLVIEDSRYGVVAAGRAGMRCLALPAEAARAQSEFELADIVSPNGAAALDLATVLPALERLGLPTV